MAPPEIFAILAVALVAGVDAAAPRKIVNGSPATLGEFKYQASIRVMGQHYCSGAIVSRRHIMTAAHCVAALTVPLTVVTGTIFTFEGEEHEPSKIDYHPKYSGAAYSSFDIAVITLANDITFSTVQNMIALPTGPAPVGVLATASGWGYLSNAPPRGPPSLNKIQLGTISAERCERTFAPGKEAHRNHVCGFSGPNFGVCWGDSGGPLAFNGQLIGIVSWGTPCSVGGPDVFTNVYHLLPWVDSIMNA